MVAGFLIGLVVGGSIGVFLVALLRAGADSRLYHENAYFKYLNDLRATGQIKANLIFAPGCLLKAFPELSYLEAVSISRRWAEAVCSESEDDK